MQRLLTGTPDTKRRPLNDISPGSNDGPSPRGSSYYKALLACPRQWALGYLARLEPEQLSLPLAIGILYHLCLEVYYRMLREHMNTATAMAAAYTKLDPFRAEPGYKDIIETVDRMISGYFARYEQEDASWEILAVEETIIYEGDFTYSARIDLIIRDYQGLWGVEHKTATALNQSVLEGYQLDLQVLGQVWLMEACLDFSALPPFQGIKVNVASKHKTPQYTRLDVCPSWYHLQAFERAIVAWSQIHDQYKAHGYPQSLGHCSGYARGYSRCDFYDVCHGHPDITVAAWQDATDNQLPFGYRRKQCKKHM